MRTLFDNGRCTLSINVSVDQIAAFLGESGHPHILGILQDFNHFVFLSD